VTIVFRLLRACERFGIDPFDPQLEDVGRQSLLLQYEQVRSAQDAYRDTEFLQFVGGLGRV